MSKCITDCEFFHHVDVNLFFHWVKSLNKAKTLENEANVKVPETAVLLMTT